MNVSIHKHHSHDTSKWVGNWWRTYRCRGSNDLRWREYIILAITFENPHQCPTRCCYNLCSIGRFNLRINIRIQPAKMIGRLPPRNASFQCQRLYAECAHTVQRRGSFISCRLIFAMYLPGVPGEAPCITIKIMYALRSEMRIMFDWTLSPYTATILHYKWEDSIH